MKITKYLCEIFDKENKGYVTIEDINEKIMSSIAKNFIFLIVIGFVCIFSFVIFSMIGKLFLEMIYPTGYIFGDISEDISIINFFVGISFFVIFVIIIMILYEIWEKIKLLKVVVCPLRKE